MSSDRDAEDGLPPVTAPLAQKLKAAIARAGEPSNRAIGRYLGTDGSLISKWRLGDVADMTPRHAANLAEFLKTPADYFQPPARSREALAEAATEVRDAARLLYETGHDLAETLDLLRPLLEAQAQTVDELQALIEDQKALAAELRNLVAALERREDAN